MDISDITNQPRTFEINGREITIAQLSLGRLFGTLERWVKDRHIADAKAAADHLPKAERQKFLVAAFKETPQGRDLQRLVKESLSSVPGMVKIFTLATEQAGDPMAAEDVADLITGDSINEIKPVLAWILSMPEEKRVSIRFLQDWEHVGGPYPAQQEGDVLEVLEAESAGFVASGVAELVDPDEDDPDPND